MTPYDRDTSHDYILPSQLEFMRGARHETPYERLWLAVLREAVYRYLRRPTSHKTATLRAEVADWLALDTDIAGSYGFVCAALGLDADYLREGLYRARAAGQTVFLRAEPRRSDHGIKIGEIRQRKRRKVA